MKNIEHELRETIESLVTMTVKKDSQYLSKCIDRVKILRRFSRDEELFIYRTLERLDPTVLMANRFIQASLSRTATSSLSSWSMVDLMSGFNPRHSLGVKQLWKHKRFQKQADPNDQKSGGDFFVG